MSSIKRTSPLKTEQRNKYLKALKYSAKSSVIDAVQPMRPASNQLYSQKPTLYFDVDILNRHMAQMKEAYRNLKYNNRKYKGLSRYYEETPDAFTNTLKELIKQFNQTTASVLTFDRVFRTRHSEVIADMLSRRQFELEVAGLSIVGINQLQLDEFQFRKAVREEVDFFDTAFASTLEWFEDAFNYVQSIDYPSVHTNLRV